MIEPSFWRARAVFITGATGLLGSWIVKELLSLGADVIVLRREHSRQNLLAAEGLQKNVTVVPGDLSSRTHLERVLGEYSVDTVFHLASQPLVREAKRDPVGTFEVNVAGTWNLLEAARLAGTPRVVVASSANAYGTSDQLPCCEDDPLRGEYPYDVSKCCADMLASCFATTYGMAVAVTRCGNLFGGGDFNFSRMIPGLIQSTYRGEKFVIRSNGQFIRDYLYIKDGVSAYLVLAQRLAADSTLGGEAFNFSLEIRLSVLDLVAEVLSLMERSDLQPVIRNEASSEIRARYLSCEKARSRLGWRPKYSLQAGLRETIDWYVAHFEGRLPTVSC